MTWFRVDNDLPDHVKSERLEKAAKTPSNLAAAWMIWLLMGCDCARRRTDGAFSRARLERVVHIPRALASAACSALVEAGYLEQDGDDWRFHDWNEYQPTRRELDEERRASAERQRVWRERQRRKRNGVTDGVTSSVGHSVSNDTHARAPAPLRAPVPVPSRPVMGEEDPPTPLPDRKKQEPTRSRPDDPVSTLDASEILAILDRESGQSVNGYGNRPAEAAVCECLRRRCKTVLELEDFARALRECPDTLWPAAKDRPQPGGLTFKWLAGWSERGEFECQRLVSALDAFDALPSEPGDG